MCWVCKDGKWFYIRTDGKPVDDKKYDDAGHFREAWFG
jgi:hypothetical protein